MTELRRWNASIKAYEPYAVPDEWNVTTYSEDMAEIVNCAQCGKALAFGKCYASKEVRAKGGMGYAVCESCSDKEWDRWEAAHDDRA